MRQKCWAKHLGHVYIIEYYKTRNIKQIYIYYIWIKFTIKFLQEVSEPSWIGYNKRSGEWKWTDGTSPTQFYHWASNQNPQDDPNRCALINSNNVDNPGNWVTASCTQLHNFVCKVRITD